MDGVWDEADQKTEHMKYVEYILKEGFRLFISWGKPEIVEFTPERRLTPIKGEEFLESGFLPLKKEAVKVGQSFEITPHTLDAGVTFTVTVLDIREKDASGDRTRYLSC